jgi:small subunit ribosomal protein S7
MPRKKHIAKREPAADPIYENTLVTRFVNSLMEGGKRSTAEGIFYGAMKQVETRSGQDAMTVLKAAMNNVKPVLEVKSRRVGGANYQVPIEVRPERRTALAIRWLITYGRGRGEKTMMDKLAAEVLDASKNGGGAVKKREDTHKMAEANKAFAHYRW